VRRPVRWIESRSEAFVATVHGRGTVVDLELGFTADGAISGLRAVVRLLEFYPQGESECA